MNESIEQGAARWPALARLAGRGSVTLDEAPDAVLLPWQTSFLGAAGINEGARRYPSAAVTWTGDTAAAASGFWMHAEPMHFVAGMSNVTAVSLQGAAEVLADERRELSALMGDHLQASGMDLHVASDGQWLIRAPRTLAVTTTNPEAAAAQGIDTAMPRGADAGGLRRLMTELQMLLHAHPVNMRRAQRGVAEINAVWLWGGAALESGAIATASAPHKTVKLPRAFGNELYLRGVYRLHNQPVEELPGNAEALLSRLTTPQHAIVCVPAGDLDSLETDWLAPLLHAITGGKLAALEVILDRWRVQASRGDLRRFWRRARPLAAWAAP